jgi:hypothetical protein
MTPLRTAFQKELQDNIDYGELLLAFLKRKADRQLELIAPAQDERVVEFWRALLQMHEVQAKLVRERYLCLSKIRSGSESTSSPDC